MLPDSQKSTALEQVKRELRSILISEKHGVPLRNIENDYEMLSCNRLPYRDLGFRDVSSFMRSIPDVARENRTATGDIIYFAVWDETTAHIQKLVSNQKSKVKKKSFFTKRGGGRGGLRGGRGGRGAFSKPSSSFPRPPTFATTRPRLPQSMRGGGRWVRGVPRASSAADPSTEVSGDFRNRGASSGGFSTFVSGGRNTRNDDWGKTPNNNFRHMDSFSETENDWDKENQSSSSPSPFTSPVIHNLKIGVDNKGDRTICKNDQSDLRDYLNSKGSKTATNCDEGDLRDFLTARKNTKAAEDDENAKPLSSRGRGVVKGRQESGPGPGRRVNILPKQANNKNFNKMNPKDIPPRFLRQQMDSKPEEPRLEIRTDPISPIQHTETYDKTTESKNWVPPENGRLYLQAFQNYFRERGIPEPPIDVIAGKIARQKGFYGQIKYEDKLYYPLEILYSEEEARQNAARAFCQKMGISLSNVGGGSLEATLPTTPARMSEVVKQRVYDIITESGVFAKGLPALYKENYNEVLDPNFLPALQQATHLFNIEEPIPKRFIIYKVPEAMVKMALANMEDKDEDKDEYVSPPTLGSPRLPHIGMNLNVMFSFAYSANEIYMQKQEDESLLYEIEEFLQTLAEQSPPSSTKCLSCSTLVAACYEEGWYRAKVLTLEQESVSVFFVDYGNREQLTRTDVRLLPQKALVTETPPLAIPCCLFKPPNVEWRDDISAFFSSLSESEPVLSAKVVNYEENVCIVELSQLNGEDLTHKLVQPQPQQTDPPPTSPPRPVAAAAEQFSPTTAAVAAMATPQIQPSTATQKSAAVKLFTDDPDPLSLPETEMFAVFVCRVLSESSILLRIVDDEYSDKLDDLECLIADNFYSWPVPKKIHQSNVYACVTLPTEGSEEEEDEKKFYRVRVLRQNEKDDTYECYLLDHGDNETLPKEQLREIDSSINTSLSYQAILASLHNLDNLPTQHRIIATKILIKFTVTDSCTLMAMRRDGQQTQDDTMSSGSKKTDPAIVNRVRKIISCLKEVEPSKVADIYQKVYSTPLENVEEVIKQIPGYGFWKKSLEVELFDTSQEEDVSINMTILSVIAEVEHLQTEGKDSKMVLQDIFGDSGSASVDDANTTDSKSFCEDKEICDIRKITDTMNKQMTLTGVDIDRPEFIPGSMDRVYRYVQEQADSVAVAAAAAASANGGVSSDEPVKSLYTWSTNVDNVKDADWLSSQHTDLVEKHQAGHGDGGDSGFPPLPSWFVFELNNFSALFILQVESPSDFVAIPYDMRQSLLQMEAQLESHFSTPQKVIEVLSTHCLYAVNKDGVWHRTLYISSIEHLHRVLYPDYHQFDTVSLDQLFLLPEDLYALPFLGRKMALGAITPNSQDWPESVKFWFIQATRHKAMYGLIWDNNDNNNNKDDRLPRPLTAQLVDTSGEEDVILDDILCEKGWARHVETN